LKPFSLSESNIDRGRLCRFFANRISFSKGRDRNPIKSPATEGRPHTKSLRETDRQKFTHWQSPAITIREKKKEKACHLFHDSVNGANPTRKK